jgi:hypothetical protein
MYVNVYMHVYMYQQILTSLYTARLSCKNRGHLSEFVPSCAPGCRHPPAPCGSAYATPRDQLYVCICVPCVSIYIGNVPAYATPRVQLCVPYKSAVCVHLHSKRTCIRNATRSAMCALYVCRMCPFT